MASYGFAPAPSSYWGGGGTGLFDGLGTSFLLGAERGMNYANSMYDMQNRVQLDPYTQPAKAAQAMALRNRAMLQQYEDTLFSDWLTSGLNSLPARPQIPQVPQATSEGSSYYVTPNNVAAFDVDKAFRGSFYADDSARKEMINQAFMGPMYQGGSERAMPLLTQAAQNATSRTYRPSYDMKALNPSYAYPAPKNPFSGWGLDRYSTFGKDFF